MAGQTVNVAVLAETSKFVSGFANAGKSADGFGSKLGKLGVGAGLAVAGLAVGVGAFIKKSVDAAAASEVVAAQTAAVVKSTGGAAGRSADQIGALATKLSELTGVDDEVVQGAENIVATFTNIKGKQFDDTTAAALDLSVAMGTDAKSAAMTLGKALNDPTAGLSKLSKQGVTFTAQQKEQVAAMQKAGDVAGAQGLILAEVNKEFGGSAAAFGNTLEGTKEKIGNAFGNIQETIGGAFLPVLTAAGGKVAGFLQHLGDSAKFQAFIGQVADFLSKLLSGNSGLGQFIGTLVKVGAAASPLGNVLKFVAANASQVGPILGTLAKVVSGVFAAALPIVVTLVGALAKTFAAILPAVAQLAAVLGAALVQVILALAPLLVLVADALADLLPVVAPLIVALLKLIAPILSLVGPLLTPLIQLLVLLLKPILALVSGLLKLLVPALTFLVKGFATVVSFLSGKATPGVTSFGRLLSGAFTATIQTLGRVWAAVWAGIKAVFNLYVTAIRVVVSALVGFFSGTWGRIVKGVSSFGTGIGHGIAVVVNLVKGIPGKITRGLGNLGGLLLGAGSRLLDGLMSGIRSKWQDVQNLLGDLTNKLPDWKGPAERDSKLLTGAGALIMASLVNGLQSGTSDVKSTLNGVTDLIGAGLDGTTLTPTALSTSGSLRGGNTYVVHLSTLNPTPEVGRLVVEAINDYQRVNGARS